MLRPKKVVEYVSKSIPSDILENGLLPLDQRAPQEVFSIFGGVDGASRILIFQVGKLHPKRKQFFNSRVVRQGI